MRKIWYFIVIALTSAPLVCCTLPRAGQPTPIAVVRHTPDPAIPALQEAATPLQKVIAGAVEQTSYTFIYDPSYVRLDYPLGDVPLDRGVCADVVVRAFRKGGVDLQKEIHEDMKRAFGAYPNKWGAGGPDRNIDHRRVGNLMTFFGRQGKAVEEASAGAASYEPGDVVAWELDDGRLHIGMVAGEKVAGKAHYKVVHNIAAGAQLEDVLFAWKVVGHYRYFGTATGENEPVRAEQQQQRRKKTMPKSKGQLNRMTMFSS